MTRNEAFSVRHGERYAITAASNSSEKIISAISDAFSVFGTVLPRESIKFHI
jgi:hypothetical protein